MQNSNVRRTAENNFTSPRDDFTIQIAAVILHSKHRAILLMRRAVLTFPSVLVFGVSQLVPEMPDSREYHRQIQPIHSSDHVSITHRSARLNERRSSGLRGFFH